MPSRDMKAMAAKLEAASASVDNSRSMLGFEVYSELKVQSIAYTAALVDLQNGNLTLPDEDEEALLACIDQFCSIAGRVVIDVTEKQSDNTEGVHHEQ